jgi:hypothetical protein
LGTRNGQGVKDKFATWLTRTRIQTQTFLEKVLSSKDIIAESVIPILSSISYGLERGGYFPSNKRNLGGQLQLDSECRPWDYLAEQVPRKVTEINPQTRLNYEQAQPQFLQLEFHMPTGRLEKNIFSEIDLFGFIISTSR